MRLLGVLAGLCLLLACVVFVVGVGLLFVFVGFSVPRPEHAHEAGPVNTYPGPADLTAGESYVRVSPQVIQIEHPREVAYSSTQSARAHDAATVVHRTTSSFRPTVLAVVVPLFGLGILLVLMLLVVRALLAPGAKGRGDDDTRIMQEIYRGLAGLDKRVESLETLLLEATRATH